MLVSLAVMLLSWLAALLTCLLVAGLLTFLGRSMSYYSQPLLIIPLYAVPAALALGEVHTQLVKRVSVRETLYLVLYAVPAALALGEVHTQLVKIEYVCERPFTLCKPQIIKGCVDGHSFPGYCRLLVKISPMEPLPVE